MSSKTDEFKVTAVMIIEIMGRPKEFVTESLEEIIKQIEEEKDVKVVNRKLNEPQNVKDQKDLFISFAEVEVEVDSPITLAILMFKYMPSHVEVIEPESFIFKNFQFSDLLTEITRRLHKYEEIVKVLQFQLEKQTHLNLPKVIENNPFKEKIDSAASEPPSINSEKEKSDKKKSQKKKTKE